MAISLEVAQAIREYQAAVRFYRICEDRLSQWQKVLRAEERMLEAIRKEASDGF